MEAAASPEIISMESLRQSMGSNRIQIKGKMFGMSAECPVKAVECRMISDDVALVLKPDHEFVAVGRAGNLATVTDELKKVFKKKLETNPDIKVHLCNAPCVRDDPVLNPFPIGKTKKSLVLIYDNECSIIHNDDGE